MPYKYLKSRTKDGKLIDKHRLIMQNLIGRELLRNEVVHHKNMDTRDNRIENLQVMTARDHNILHGCREFIKLAKAASLDKMPKGEENHRSKLTVDIITKCLHKSTAYRVFLQAVFDLLNRIEHQGSTSPGISANVAQNFLTVAIFAISPPTDQFINKAAGAGIKRDLDHDPYTSAISSGTECGISPANE